MEHTGPRKEKGEMDNKDKWKAADEYFGGKTLNDLEWDMLETRQREQALRQGLIAAGIGALILWLLIGVAVIWFTGLVAV